MNALGSTCCTLVKQGCEFQELILKLDDQRQCLECDRIQLGCHERRSGIVVNSYFIALLQEYAMFELYDILLYWEQ